jgi:hypothetical protein
MCYCRGVKFLTVETAQTILEAFLGFCGQDSLGGIPKISSGGTLTNSMKYGFKSGAYNLWWARQYSQFAALLARQTYSKLHSSEC